MLTGRPEIAAWIRSDLIGWLTTVSPDGQPQTSPVWHVVDGDDLVIYSRSDATRLRNLASNPLASYNLRGDRQGDHVVSMEGRAIVDRSIPSPLHNPDYMTKYGAEIDRLGWTHEWYDANFETPLRFMITRLRSW